MAWKHTGDVITCPGCKTTWRAGGLVPCECEPDEEVEEFAPAEYQIAPDLLDTIEPAAQAVLTFDGCMVALAKGWHELRGAECQTEIKAATCRLQYLKFIREQLHNENALERVRALEKGNAEVRDLHDVAGGSAQRDDIPPTTSDDSGPTAARRN